MMFLKGFSKLKEEKRFGKKIELEKFVVVAVVVVVACDVIWRPRCRVLSNKQQFITRF
jgi:hypothetical protein